MPDISNMYDKTPRGNHWIGTSSSQFSQYRTSANTSRRGQGSANDGTSSDMSGGYASGRGSNDVGRDSSAYTGKVSYSRFESRSGKSGVDLNQPLISTEVVEAAKQRTLALIVFIIIQLYKFYDLVLLKSGLPISGFVFVNQRTTFVSKYLLIDSLFFYVLSTFKIPKLVFKSWVILVQIVLMSLITIGISSHTDFVLISSILALWKRLNTKELSVLGTSVNQRSLFDSSAHFKGALTIKILPENTAMLNPFHSAYCFPVDNSLFEINSIKVPIRINSTAEIHSIQLEHRDIFTNERELLNLTKNDWKLMTNIEDYAGMAGIPLSTDVLKEEAKTSIKYLSVPLPRTGFYQIKSIVDSNGLNLRIFNSHIIVPQCPVAKISGYGASDRCIGDNDKVQIEVQGVAPMKLAYTKSVNGEEQYFYDSNLQPELFESPLHSNTKTSFSVSDLADLSWAQNQNVMINLDSMINSNGVHRYSMVKLIDGLGNVMDFSKLEDDSSKILHCSYDFNVHSIPKASLEEVIDSKSPTKRSIILHFEEERNSVKGSTSESNQYSAKFSFLSTDGKKKYFEVSTNTSTYDFPAEYPGTFTLESVKSNYCAGVIVGKSNVLISQPVLPQLKVSGTPILDKCVGQVGLSFDLTFSGIPPFYFITKIYKYENGVKKLFDRKRYKSPSTRYQFNYNPTTEGNYEIEFDNLTNELFTDPISLSPKSEYMFKTSMRVKPRASLTSSFSKALCLGDSTELSVKLIGEPPFKLKYDIIDISSNKRKSFSVDDIETNEYNIKTPAFSTGGDYILSLATIEDASGCVVPLTESDAKIKVRRDTPYASINTREKQAKFQIKEGSVSEIPLKLSGEGPFFVKYVHIDSNGKTLGTLESRFDSNYKTVLKLFKEGTYKLVSMSDSSCKGDIINPENVVSVSYLEKPAFKVVEQSNIKKTKKNLFFGKSVCQGIQGSVDILLSGSPPFNLKYDLLSPDGIVTEKSMQVTTKHATIKFPEHIAGEYVATIKSVSDSNYNESDMNKSFIQTKEITIKQLVNPTPVVSFSELGKTYRTCISNIEQHDLLEKISLQLVQGSEPFVVTFNVYHESTGRTERIILKNVTKDSFPYENLYKDLKLGSHDITIESVVDSNGCSNYFHASENEHIIISVTDAPKIQLLDPSASYCVGDYVSYQLTGSAPFTIKYQFNEMHLKATEHSTQFIRLASEPGIISVNSIADASSQCQVNFTMPSMLNEYEKLSLVIHPIPSVTVSQGKYLIEDIHEGDQAEVVFSFEGTPPFSLTYVRTEESPNAQKAGSPHIIETHKVTDIYGYEYRVKTSLQGTYEAIEISDAYCFAKNDAFFQ
ncbi:hypothetical protein Kpol_1025p9 [Vanderwaltozyma polyspora DSM 70294]|uniref:Nucleoporin POM152 n=1 Tax=Vanderwaltozyma polyspora (strain ATCC 22028 / DSM 70294 / BCRC 21397 / CBS 2163 / NBRC 10782 / NRRL Y-8283 / UCD 57-17) TaxID=436907 RepID=A7TKT5_VANPO|nr:uncharacterized protein Kpol_1025p9 [Vanderwaltozyma polyspora DSM 70294]EDO17090.1 hypothetical protein Kpol_1025p9 [Vanderwaltozyma polyspora DSM 70294]